MEQYWQVINLDKRQTLGHWGKLGECLFDGLPNTLVLLLEQDATNSSAIPPKKTWAGDWLEIILSTLVIITRVSQLECLPPRNRRS